MSQKSRTKSPGQYRALRVALLERGFTLRSFALTHGYSVPTTYMAANGSRSGIITTRIRKHLEKLANE